MNWVRYWLVLQVPYGDGLGAEKRALFNLHDYPRMKAPRPTGRRRITEAQMRATAGLTGAFAPTSPGLVLAAFKAAAPTVRFPGSLVLLIDNLMRYTRPIDWQVDWPPIVWPSNAELADRLGLEIGRIKQLVAALDACLILARDHGTHKRFGKRGEGGRILYAYGFDLSLLAERMVQSSAQQPSIKRSSRKAGDCAARLAGCVRRSSTWPTWARRMRWRRWTGRQSRCRGGRMSDGASWT